VRFGPRALRRRGVQQTEVPRTDAATSPNVSLAFFLSLVEIFDDRLGVRCTDLWIHAGRDTDYDNVVDESKERHLVQLWKARPADTTALANASAAGKSLPRFVAMWQRGL
jgi:hypothetical protein